MDLQDRILQEGEQDVRYMFIVHRLQQDSSTSTGVGTITCNGKGIGGSTTTCTSIGTFISTGKVIGTCVQDTDYCLTEDESARLKHDICIG